MKIKPIIIFKSGKNIPSNLDIVVVFLDKSASAGTRYNVTSVI